MTKEELEGNHEHYVLNDAASYHHVNISIEYAISVLSELADGYQFMSEDGVAGIPMGSIYDKLKELKSLIK